MKNSLKMIGNVVFIVTICFSVSMCSWSEEYGDILLVNQYHEPIIMVIADTRICDAIILQGDSDYVSVPLGVEEVYVITKDNKVSNSIKIIVVDDMIETIILNADGILDYKE